jgi:predicted dehydrogenase
MSSDTIRIGIVGAGRNTTTKHIPGLQAIDGVEIVSVCNRSRESARRVGQQFNIPEVYDHWWALVEAPDTEAIIIGTWPYLHHPVTLAALAAGKHVMCEARMAMNAQEAQAMLAAAHSKPHLVAQIVPSPFTLGVDKTIKRLITNGYLGDILAIEVRENGIFIDRDAPLHWRQNFELSGFNVLGLGIWYEAIMRWVGQATQVVAMGKTFVKMRKDPATGTMYPVRVPEHLDVIADMACGAQAHFGLSSVAGLADGVEMTLFGSDGTLHFAGGELYGKQRDDSELQEITIRPEDEGGWRVEEEFVNAIRGEEVITHTSFADGLKYMEFTEAVARSMTTGRAITLPL